MGSEEKDEKHIALFLMALGVLVLGAFGMLIYGHQVENRRAIDAKYETSIELIWAQSDLDVLKMQLRDCHD